MHTLLPLEGGVEILLVVSCYGNYDKLQPGGSLGLYADFTLNTMTGLVALKMDFQACSLSNQWPYFLCQLKLPSVAYMCFSFGGLRML